MFSLLSTTPTLTAASAASAPRGSARGGGRRVASTAVVASTGPATTPKIGAMCERVQRIAASSVLAAALVSRRRAELARLAATPLSRIPSSTPAADILCEERRERAPFYDVDDDDGATFRAVADARGEFFFSG